MITEMKFLKMLHAILQKTFIEKAHDKFKDKLVVQWNSLQKDAGFPS